MRAVHARVIGGTTHFAAVPIRVAAGPDPNRPQVVIEQPPPYELDATVTLRGRGFQAADDNLAIGWCFFRSDDPATEPQGDAADGHAGCVYPDPGFLTLPIEADGTFVIEDFPLPDDSFRAGGLTCADAGARCGLAEHPTVGSQPTFLTLLQMAR